MKATWIGIAIWLIASATYAQKDKPVIRKGNDFYEDQKFTEAEVAYRKALEIDSENFEGQFNLGNALIKQKKYDESFERLQILAGTEKDKTKLAEVFHNLGNAYLESQKLEESISAYKSALRNNPADNETRYNLAYAQTLLKKQQEQEQKEDQNKDENKEDQDKKDKEKKDKEDQQKKDQEQKDQEKDKKDQGQDEKDKKEQEQQKQQQQEQEVSKQMAEQLLNALEQDEKKVKEKVQMQQKQNAKTRKVEKDW